MVEGRQGRVIALDGVAVLNPQVPLIQLKYVDQAANLTPGPFDLVFTTWGTICWLPDMAVWAKVIASVLAPAIDAGTAWEVSVTEVTGAPLDWVGTGWLVADNIIVTNRHVANEFAARKGVWCIAHWLELPVIS